MKTIAFQGEYGAFSDLACRTAYPNVKTVPCTSFKTAFEAVQNGEADCAMIPVDNTIAGRVADVHHLLPDSDLFIVAEHFQPISHHFLGLKGASMKDARTVHSHIHALPQCRNQIEAHNLSPVIEADTASAAKYIAESNDLSRVAIASELAAEIYDLDILKRDVQDFDQNTTRFLILSAEPIVPDVDSSTISSLMFTVRNIPAALYKALGGFATNHLSMTKLESYVDKKFQGAQFYCEVEGHPDTDAFRYAIEELGFYANDVKFMGAYPAHPFRRGGYSEIE